MDRNQLHTQVAHMRQSLLHKGYLDEQLIHLEELQDESNPNFVEEVAALFYRDSSRLLANIEQAMERSPLDFVRLENYMQQLTGRCSSIGAKKVKNQCAKFREFCRTGNTDGCMKTFQQLKREYAALKQKLEAYFQVYFLNLPLSKCLFLCHSSYYLLNLIYCTIDSQLARQAGPRNTETRPR
ncbi:hypothetical protein V2J09_004695 [Rumex salicifolius]